MGTYSLASYFRAEKILRCNCNRASKADVTIHRAVGCAMRLRVKLTFSRVVVLRKLCKRHKRSIESVASYFKTEKIFRSGCNGASKTDIAIVVIRTLRVPF